MLPTLAPASRNILRSSLLPTAKLVASVNNSRRGMASSSGGGGEIKSVTVFGAGLMGAGIAQVAAQSGLKVVLSDVTDKALDNGLQIISKSLARIAKRQRPDDIEGFSKEVLKRIEVTTNAEKAVEHADLVVEAIIESIKIKRDLFAFLDDKASKDCIFATNTSSLSVTEIAETCGDDRKTKFAGLHFFNPVPTMKLVEIIALSTTSASTISLLNDLAHKMGKAPVQCKDTPGFIVNRLLMPYLLDAIRMVERGEATFEDIDTAMQLGAGYPMGPFKLLDFIGLDTTSYIASGWTEKAKQGLIAEELVKPIPLLEKLVKEGKLGKKSGEGFYDYSSKL